jgi:hypothetical protein
MRSKKEVNGNSVNELDGNELRLELKYCERCGGLWLRPSGGPQIYCVTCAREVRTMPVPAKPPQRQRLKLPQGTRSVLDDRGPEGRGFGRRQTEPGEFEGCGGIPEIDLEASGGAA